MPENNKKSVTPGGIDNMLKQSFLEMDFNDPKNEALLEKISAQIMLTNTYAAYNNPIGKIVNLKYISLGVAILLSIPGIILFFNTTKTEAEKNDPNKSSSHNQTNVVTTSKSTYIQNIETKNDPPAASHYNSKSHSSNEQNKQLVLSEDSTANNLAIHPLNTNPFNDSNLTSQTIRDSTTHSFKHHREKTETADKKQKKRKAQGKWVEREIKIYPR